MIWSKRGSKKKIELTERDWTKTFRVDKTYKTGFQQLAIFIASKRWQKERNKKYFVWTELRSRKYLNPSFKLTTNQTVSLTKSTNTQNKTWHLLAIVILIGNITKIMNIIIAFLLITLWVNWAEEITKKKKKPLVRWQTELTFSDRLLHSTQSLRKTDSHPLRQAQSIGCSLRKKKVFSHFAHDRDCSYRSTSQISLQLENIGWL